MSAGPAQAHGVELFVENLPTLQMRAAYDDGEPMSYAKVAIYAPNNPERAFQRGRTDHMGRFAFCPDAKGSWRVVISDGMGHQIDRKLEVRDTEAGVEANAPKAEGVSKTWKVVVGLSLIFGLFGLAALFWTYFKRPRQGGG